MELDELLGYRCGRAVRLAQAGKLPCVILPDSEIRFDPDAIADLIQQCTRRLATKGGAA